MPTTWSEAPKEIIEMTKTLIRMYHPALEDARIAVIMRSEAPESNGQITFGKARKVSAEQQVHIPFDFVIWLAKDWWLRFSDNQKTALLDHELSHCQWDGFVAKTRGHDVEEFNHIIKRYGFWWPQSDSFAVAVQQALPLPREQEGGVDTIDFAKIAKAVAEELGAERVEVTYHPATGRGE
jgi:hypothetical protein